MPPVQPADAKTPPAGDAAAPPADDAAAPPEDLKTALPRKITATDTDADDYAYDKKMFDAQARECLGDERIVTFFKRDLVARVTVLGELDAGDAMAQAVALDEYAEYSKARLHIREIVQRRDETIRSGAINLQTVIVGLALATVVTLCVNQLSQKKFVDTLLVIATAVSGCVAAILLGYVAREHTRWKQLIPTGLLALAFSVSCIQFPQATFKHPPNLIMLSVDCAAGLLAGSLLSSRKTFADCLALIKMWREDWDSSTRKENLQTLLLAWLEKSADDVIMGRLVQIINGLLGEIRDELLVEQNSVGLRRVRDPEFTVTTRSDKRVEAVLSQMDGGSIALAGPRGAGKSTLLRTFSGQPATAEQTQPTISVLVSAPAEYEPRDFIAEVFQHLCEAYLKYRQGFVPDVLRAKRAFPRLRRAARKGLELGWLLFRTAAALAIVAWIAWPFIKPHYPHDRHAIAGQWDHDRHHTAAVLKSTWTKYQRLIKSAIVLFALLFFPFRGPWRRWRRRRARLPEQLPLAEQAQEYLSRLRVDKTITSGATLNSPSLQGLGMSLQRGSSVRYMPWTLPELVRNLQQFMRDIAAELPDSSRAVLVGIDEIDRIGTLEHAERFIGEIKAIFGVERCFFLVSVAEDVGSVFAQRATAGRSILENAFDNIITVEPLSLDETSVLLTTRVPGFTETFVYLVYALSGGLPRELIRISRRLVEVNLELQQRPAPYPLISELSLVLVAEELAEAIRAARNQLSPLVLGPGWTEQFERLRTAGMTLRSGSRASAEQALEVITILSELSPPAPAAGTQHHNGTAASGPTGEDGASQDRADEVKARRVIDDLAAFAYFGLAVADAFRDEHFSLDAVRDRTAAGPPGWYEELALARAELSISTASSQSMLRRFRETLTGPPAAAIPH